MIKGAMYIALDGEKVELTTDQEKPGFKSSVKIVKDIIFNINNPSVLQVVWGGGNSTFMSGVPFYYFE